MNLIYRKFNQHEFFTSKHTHSRMSNALWHYYKRYTYIDFFFLETILASPSKYFRSPKIVNNFTLKSVDNFWFERWDKRTLSSSWIVFFLFLLLLLCNSFCLSLSHYVTIENMVVWQTPTVTALEYRQTQDSPATFHILSRESMENLLSNGSLQHHQFFFVSEPHDSTKHKVFHIVN